MSSVASLGLVAAMTLFVSANAFGQSAQSNNGTAWHPDTTYHPDEINAARAQAQDCVPVRRGEYDAYGDWVNVRASLCTDANGETQVAPGSQQVIHDW